MRIKMLVHCPSCGNQIIKKVSVPNNGFKNDSVSVLCKCSTQFEVGIKIEVCSSKQTDKKGC